jgi:amidophosphoribosyltransferase
VKGKKILFCDDPIVRGTQLQDTIKRLFDVGAEEVHMRPACPPLVHGCKFLNFSVSRTEDALAARRAVRKIEGEKDADLSRFSDPDTPEYAAMEEEIRRILNLTSLKYQRLDDLIAAIGLPKEKLCTFCWNGKER